MTEESLFAVWCLIKPVALGALIGIAEDVADGLDTPVAALSPLAREARLEERFTLGSLQSLSLPLNRTGLMEGLCREERDLRTQLVEEISQAGGDVVPGLAFHSEYTLWRLVGECLETLTGRQASTALNNLLSSADLDIQFSLDPSSLMVDRLVDYFTSSNEQLVAVPHSRSGVLLSTWSMSLGGFASSRAVAEWSRLAFFREPDDLAQCPPLLFPTPHAMERIANECLSGDAAAVLGMRCELHAGRLVSRGWLGLSALVVDLGSRWTCSAFTNDMSCDSDRLFTLLDIAAGSES